MTGKKTNYVCSILYFILLVSSGLISDVNAKSYRSSNSRNIPSSHRSHSYPSHSGLSGHHSSVQKHTYPSAHTYPASHSSGTGGHSSHSYPAASPHSLSGGSSGSAAYPSHTGSSYGTSHGSASYPSSNGLSGNTAYGTRTGVASYPSSNGLSGNTAVGAKTGVASYPSSNGLSGNTATGNHYSTSGSSYPHNSYPSSNVHHSSWNSQPGVNYVHHNTNSRTEIHHHHHYSYRPPTVIHYSSSYGMSPMSYPVYTGTPPTYVYNYISSGNKYSNLLAGLALYNLGRMSSNSHANYYHNNYNPQPNEHCKFGVQYRTGGYEEMAINCQSITYFIYESQPQYQPQTQTHVTTNIVNQTTVTTQTIYPNGTLVVSPNKQTQVLAGNTAVIPNTQQALTANGVVLPNTQQVNTVTTTTTQTVSVTDPKLAGKPVSVSPEMECYVIRISPYSNMKKPVPCGLLQEYAASSLRRNSAVIIKSYLTLIVLALAILL